ncbi:MAG: sigma-70 family RNA polymerase sigma factor [bacterium]|nr:sigma-70 family RNA polymerase sigma factor [bacterium]
MNTSQEIIAYKPLLQSIALRMVGSLSDAEDIVQDTFLKWLTIDRAKIENTKAYLVRAVTNNCINHLKSLKTNYIDKSIDNLKQSDLAEYFREIEISKFDIENELAEAMQTIHRKLEPLEKSIFIMREFFNVEYEELQEMFGKSAANCRKMVSRARAKLAIDLPKIKINIPDTSNLLTQFRKASHLGSMNGLINELKKDIQKKIK